MCGFPKLPPTSPDRYVNSERPAPLIAGFAGLCRFQAIRTAADASGHVLPQIDRIGLRRKADRGRGRSVGWHEFGLFWRSAAASKISRFCPSQPSRRGRETPRAPSANHAEQPAQVAALTVAGHDRGRHQRQPSCLGRPRLAAVRRGYLRDACAVQNAHLPPGRP